MSNTYTFNEIEGQIKVIVKRNEATGLFEIRRFFNDSDTEFDKVEASTVEQAFELAKRYMLVEYYLTQGIEYDIDTGTITSAV